jgi:hypothetical protein
MASIYKASSELKRKAGDKGKGRARDDDGEIVSQEVEKKARKDKVLMLCSRGVTQRHRHLMRDLEVLLPHTKKGEWHTRGCLCCADASARLKARHEIVPTPDQRAGRPALVQQLALL